MKVTFTNGVHIDCCKIKVYDDAFLLDGSHYAYINEIESIEDNSHCTRKMLMALCTRILSDYMVD